MGNYEKWVSPPKPPLMKKKKNKKEEPPFIFVFSFEVYLRKKDKKRGEQKKKNPLFFFFAGVRVSSLFKWRTESTAVYGLPSSPLWERRGGGAVQESTRGKRARQTERAGEREGDGRSSDAKNERRKEGAE